VSEEAVLLEDLLTVLRYMQVPLWLILLKVLSL
jgi:hypothetical protein